MIGVLLSGTGADGIEGLRTIRAAGGICLVQDPRSAPQPAGPAQAISSGLADRVLPPDGLGRELVVLSDRLRDESQKPASKIRTKEDLQPILKKLLERTGVDFRPYKLGTLQRRTERRMALAGVRDSAEFDRYLEAHPEEVEELFEDLLIHVTSFFRDPETFEALSRTVLPEILRSKKPAEAIRVWVPGCSTGEEVYSVAMVLLEALDRARAVHPVQIFASDVSARALERARQGVYPEGIRRAVSPDRLKRHFTRTASGFRVGKPLREMCIFVQHDLTRNPPFSRLDLLSCRNLLIYLEPELQERMIQVFHLALRPGGTLVLSDSESIPGAGQLFGRVAGSTRFYVRKPGEPSLRVGFAAHPPPRPQGGAEGVASGLAGSAHLERQALDVLLSRHLPAAFVVDARLEILHLWGRTEGIVAPSPGRPEMNLLKILRQELRADARLGVYQASRTGKAVRREMPLKGRARRGSFTLEIEPLPAEGDAADRSFLVLIREIARPGARPRTRGRAGLPERAREEELARLREALASTIESSQAYVREYESLNASLNAANEEILSTNEELRSTNEEFETAKEELQTANEEVSARNQELVRLTADLTNLLSSSETAVVMLDAERRIRRATPRAQAVLNLLPSDEGRPLSDLKMAITEVDLDPLIDEASRGRTVAREVRDRSGRWYALQVRPYRTSTGQVDGTVVSLHNIDSLKRREEERELARRVLEESERRFRRMADEAPVLIWMSGTDALCTYFNRPWLEFRGRTLEQEMGNGWAEGVHPEDFDRCLKTYLEAFGARRPFEMEYRLRRADGAYRWITERGVPLGLSDGTFVGYIGACLDITGRKEAEGAAARLAAIVESSADAILSMTLEGEVTSWNRSAERLYGYPAGEMVGQPIARIIPEGRQAEEREILARVARGERVAQLETERKTKDGTIVPVSLTISPVRDPGGKIMGVSKIARDITETKRAEERFRTAIESAPNAMLLVDRDGRIRLVNAQAERVFGYARQELLGRPIEILVPERFRGGHSGHRTGFFAQPQTRAMGAGRDLYGLRKDGSEVPLSIGLTPMKTAEGDFVLAGIVDLTERKKAEDVVRQMNATLEERVRERTALLEAAVRELETFTYTVAHDLRAPLRGMHRFSSLLVEEKGAGLDEEGKDWARRVAEGARRMDTLIENLLAYSRIGREGFALAEIDPSGLVSDILSQLRGEIEERKARVEVEGSLPRVRGDRLLLGQALTNLVSNALKFVPPSRTPVVRIRGFRRGERVRLVVEDNGIGIDPRHRNRLFRIFERLHGRDEYPGTGIGLAIVKKAVEQMGGEAGFEPVEGEGTRFYVELIGGGS